MDTYDDIPKYRKKKNNDSKSSKRSDHKHQYKRIILKGFIGWIWGEKCEICGRVKAKPVIACREFIRPECQNPHLLSERIYYTYEELVNLYPDVEVIDKAPWDFI